MMTNNPQPLPRPSNQHYLDPEVRYALSEPHAPPAPQKRAVRPRQDVLASVLGKLDAGCTYLISYKESIAPEYLFGLMRSLDRLGRQFAPPITFVYLSTDHAAALALTIADIPPKLIAPNKMHQSAHDRRERYYPPAP